MYIEDQVLSTRSDRRALSSTPHSIWRLCLFLRPSVQTLVGGPNPGATCSPIKPYLKENLLTTSPLNLSLVILYFADYV